MSDPYTPVEIDPRDRELLEKIGRLRVLAWSTVIPNAADKVGKCWLDEFDPVARHWCVFHEKEPIAAARLSVHDQIGNVPDAYSYRDLLPEQVPPPIAALSRLVTHPGFRGRGLSEALDRVRVEVADLTGCRVVIGCTPSGPDRITQLRRLGFETATEPVAEPNDGLFSGMWSRVIIRRMDRDQESAPI